jgi:hypothetical protein
MKKLRLSLLIIACATPALLLLGAATAQKQTQTERAARGEYLVRAMGCNDCHTPLKFTDKGPEPDMTRMLSGHPQDTKLPPPDLKPGPWFAATAGMTAWAGPWGISYTANLTPDRNTGLGIWTEERACRQGGTWATAGHYFPLCPGRALEVSVMTTSRPSSLTCELCRPSATRCPHRFRRAAGLSPRISNNGFVT